jgi:AraC-like DNA-binding protein
LEDKIPLQPKPDAATLGMLQPERRTGLGPIAASVAMQPAAGHVRVGPLQPVAALLREQGVDPCKVLEGCGLPEDTLEHPDRLIPFRSAAQLVQRAAWTLQREDFGLIVGQRFELDMFGLLGELIGHTARVDSALQVLSRYFHLQDRGSVPYLRQVDDRLLALGYAIYDADTPGLGLIYDMALSMGMTILRTLCGSTFQCARVHIAHGKPKTLLPYRRCFGAPVSFDAARSEIQFESAWLRAPVSAARHAALDGARRAADGRAGDLRQWSERAHAAVRVLVMDGSLSSPRVAKALGIHERTLRRRLADEKSTLQLVTSQVRFDLARQLLRETSLPLSDIATTLGYADATAFTRFFRRLSDRTPGLWRREQWAAQLGPQSGDTTPQSR